MSSSEPRRVDKVKRFKNSYSVQMSDDQLQEYMNILGMVFSMCGLMMKVNFSFLSFFSNSESKFLLLL